MLPPPPDVVVEEDEWAKLISVVCCCWLAFGFERADEEDEARSEGAIWERCGTVREWLYEGEGEATGFRLFAQGRRRMAEARR